MGTFTCLICNWVSEAAYFFIFNFEKLLDSEDSNILLQNRILTLVKHKSSKRASFSFIIHILVDKNVLIMDCNSSKTML